jgi:hypothetical protein
MPDDRKVAETPELEELRKRIRVIMHTVSDTMIEGGCKNFPEYTNMTGTVKGLAIAERELLDFDEQLTREE